MLTNIFSKRQQLRWDLILKTASYGLGEELTNCYFVQSHPSRSDMAGDKVPSIYQLEKPENVHEMLRKDRQEDCLSCKVVGRSRLDWWM